MANYILNTDQQGVLLDYFPNALESVAHIPKGETLWLLSNNQEWKRNVLDAKRHTNNIVLLTYELERQEMQTALVLGARAYCHALSATSMFDSVSRVLDAGGMWIPNELLAPTTRNIANQLNTSAALSQLSHLTKRERDVLSGILEGRSNKEIARDYGISERTVKEHVGTLLQKFDAKDRINLLLRVGEFSHLKGAL
ncbi:MAG: response regulator transcription factor [Pseudomonadota bacterium]|uniref:LuxR C-terminal-related transcriptional regulator n=1 Tax=Alteromonas sp. MTD1 TaxID=3057962 RepID=UPI002E9959B3|nr:response regulator transcription factor [Pseudomonadota bacterium]